jgi:hypothetical protein
MSTLADSAPVAWLPVAATIACAGIHVASQSGPLAQLPEGVTCVVSESF